MDRLHYHVPEIGIRTRMSVMHNPACRICGDPSDHLGEPHSNVRAKRAIREVLDERAGFRAKMGDQMMGWSIHHEPDN